MPVLSFRVPSTQPEMTGSPYSRPSMAEWLRMPPTSVMTAAAMLKSGVHTDEVSMVTRMSPGLELVEVLLRSQHLDDALRLSRRRHRAVEVGVQLGPHPRMRLLSAAQHRAARYHLAQLGDVSDEQLRLLPAEARMLHLPPGDQLLGGEAAEDAGAYLLRQAGSTRLADRR